MLNEESRARLIREKEAAHYVGLGLTKFRQWAKEIGAVRHFGRAVRYDIEVIDAELARMSDEGTKEETEA